MQSLPEIIYLKRLYVDILWTYQEAKLKMMILPDCVALMVDAQFVK